jgi:hypothetical protein
MGKIKIAGSVLMKIQLELCFHAAKYGHNTGHKKLALALRKNKN